MIKIHTEGFVSALHDLEAGVRNAGVQAVVSAVKAAVVDAKATKSFMNHRTEGGLRDSISSSVFGVKGEIHADAGVANWIENGTDPHEIGPIAPTNKKALKFVTAGSVVFARSTKRFMHPGTKGTYFMAHAGQVGEQALEYGMDFYLAPAIAKFNGG